MIPAPFVYTSFIAIVVSLITAILGPIIVLWVKDKVIDKSKTPTPMTEAINLNSLVDNQVEIILEELECDRIWIAQCHNGGNFYPTGKSMAKFSVIYETVNIGIGSIQSMFQNIQVNLFSKSINELQQNDTIQISDYKDPSIATFGLKYIAEDTGCKSGYLIAIKTIDDKFIGILGLDYSKKKTKLDVDQINHLINYATAIGGVLSGSKEV